MSLSGKRAVVWGLGVFGGGLAAARYLLREGARVRVLDRKAASDLAASVGVLEKLDVELVLGRPHRWEDFQGADLVVKSPAIPPSASWVARLEQAGIRLSSEIELGLAHVEAPFAVVTGSKGKSTTTALLGEMLTAAGFDTETAGNNERPLLDVVLSGRAPERLVLEISSFMGDALVRAAGSRQPIPVALALTSLGPEHLNWHGDVESYYEAKLALLDLGPKHVVIPAGDPELNARVPARIGRAPTLTGGVGATMPVAPGSVVVREGVALELPDTELFRVQSLSLLGGHNLQNALVAAATARAMGATPEAIARAVEAFRPLPHRLETVAVSREGVRFINDSMATTPAAAMAALRAVPAPVVLLAGGSDKGARYEEFAVEAAKAHAVICMGEIREALGQAIESASSSGAGSAQVVRVDGSFDSAFSAALAACPAGGALLLAPATASYDMFPNFKARGERFRALAQAASK